MPSQLINGINLNVVCSGRGTPVVLLHGFTGSSKTWRPFVQRLASSYMLVRPDIIGHGESDSPVDSTRYSMAHAVTDLNSLLDSLNIESAHWLGYSMGGRVALQFALAHPDRVRSLILEGTSPGITNERERALRKTQDDELADRIAREGLISFVDFWESIPLFASQQRLPRQEFARQRQQRLANDPAGLAKSLRGMGQGTYPGVSEQLRRLTMPVLLVVGQEDAKFQATSRTMVAQLSDGRIESIPDAGHAAHLEQPEAFISIVEQFLDEQERSSWNERTGAGDGSELAVCRRI